MDQLSSTHLRRALIVEDEVVIALDLQEAMSSLGFEISDLAANPNRAFSLAMSNQPDLVLMDVCLDGGREGIEAGRWLREVCGVPCRRRSRDDRAQDWVATSSKIPLKNRARGSAAIV